MTRLEVGDPPSAPPLNLYNTFSLARAQLFGAIAKTIASVRNIANHVLFFIRMTSPHSLSVLSPPRAQTCPFRQLAQRGAFGNVLAFLPSGNNRLVGHRLVRIAGQERCNRAALRRA